MNRQKQAAIPGTARRSSTPGGLDGFTGPDKLQMTELMEAPN
jgi:hypothetical protein